MKVTVWHAKEPNFGMGPSRRFPEEYSKVAVVECEGTGMVALEEAFALTNHIDSDWTRNKGIVELPSGGGQRSTSVGDVAVDEDGTAFRCASCGWEVL